MLFSAAFARFRVCARIYFFVIFLVLLPYRFAVVRIEIFVDLIYKQQFFVRRQIQKSVKNHRHVFFHVLSPLPVNLQQFAAAEQKFSRNRKVKH
jgi:hypothetical protein